MFLTVAVSDFSIFDFFILWLLLHVGYICTLFLVCGVPPEYCEYSADYEKCKVWMRENLPEIFEKLGQYFCFNILSNASLNMYVTWSVSFSLTMMWLSLSTAVGISCEVGEVDEKEEKKRQKRGGKAAHKSLQKKTQPQRICLSKAPRGKKKMFTVISGLATFGTRILFKYLPHSRIRVSSMECIWRFRYRCESGE